jgi:protein TonB
MFDLIAGGTRHPFHDRTLAPAVVTAIVHGIVIGTVILVPLLLATNTLPPVPTMMAFVTAVPLPPPPPPPPRRVESPAVRPVATTGKNAAPIDAPAAVQPEPVAVSDDEGVEGGVEGGLIGGVVTGIVGGLLTEPLPPPPPSPPPPRGPVRIGGKITAPALLYRVEPIYPSIAVLAKVSGVVILETTVGADGTVNEIQVLRSVKLLDQAAIDAVRHWRYSPLVLNGVATPFILTVTLSFRIPN